MILKRQAVISVIGLPELLFCHSVLCCVPSPWQARRSSRLSVRPLLRAVLARAYIFFSALGTPFPFIVYLSVCYEDIGVMI